MKLKEFFLKSDMTLMELCTKAAVSWSTMYNCQNGKPIRLNTAKKIVKATKGQVTLDDIEITGKFKDE